VRAHSDGWTPRPQPVVSQFDQAGAHWRGREEKKEEEEEEQEEERVLTHASGPPKNPSRPPPHCEEAA
jgi:hypothetical protein